MAKTSYKGIEVESFIKTKIQTTYEYRPIIGEILGYCRKNEVAYIGDTIELHIKTPLEAYDRLLINGKEIDIKSLTNKQ